ncbi:hypothetical protein E1091_00240 [Micromonospora fluostatini]|uniref:Uncharacterized protein n=1 Tax=Micromonospora fluostatini TaxID=1629071 RepID=A0ABY2DM76_9ACTN|nr:hypothetical protein E1091_00240 [Micromonospora fluostatini]
MDASEYMAIPDQGKRESVRQDAAAILEEARFAMAELMAAEAALLLLPYFADVDKDRWLLEDDARPGEIEFRFHPAVDSHHGASADITMVWTRAGVVLWDVEDESEIEFEGPVTDFLAGAVEVSPSYFLTAGPDLYRYILPS